MHFGTLAVLASVLAVFVEAQEDTCGRLKTYSLAQQQCSQSYAVPTPTVTSTTTTTVRPTATTTTRSSTKSQAITMKPTTTSAPAYNDVRTRTVIAVEEVTVTDCRAAWNLQCPFNKAAGNGLSSPSSSIVSSPVKVSTTISSSSRSTTTTRGARFGREAGPEPIPQQFGSSSNSYTNDIWNMFLWLSVKAQGTTAVKDMCACILPPASKTVTVSKLEALRSQLIYMKGREHCHCDN